MNLMEDKGESLAVKVASAETLIIQQTKAWLKEHCALDFEALDRKACKRSHNVLLVKNIPATTKDYELRELFERYGTVDLKISPFNTLAIVGYESSKQAQAALRNLAYHKVNYLTPIYLEYAPVGIIEKATVKESSESESEAEEVEEKETAGDKKQR